MGDRQVAAARELDTPETVLDAEHRLEGLGHRRAAGAAGA